MKLTCYLLLFLCCHAHAQQLLETGGQKPMPDEWIDKDTHHKVIRLTRKPGENASFYFHNDPFIRDAPHGDRMVFYSTDKAGRQLYAVNLKTKETVQLTQQALPMKGEIVGHKNHEVYYQIEDSVFATHADTRKTRLVFVFPAGFKGSVTTLNADETLLGGVHSTDAEKEILRQNPEKHD
jgi:oligogalacturonide lyase